jgi:hypothetical protein
MRLRGGRVTARRRAQSDDRPARVRLAALSAVLRPRLGGDVFPDRVDGRLAGAGRELSRAAGASRATLSLALAAHAPRRELQRLHPPRVEPDGPRALGDEALPCRPSADLRAVGRGAGPSREALDGARHHVTLHAQTRGSGAPPRATGRKGDRRRGGRHQDPGSGGRSSSSATPVDFATIDSMV